MCIQVRLALELVFEGLQTGDHPTAHVTGAPAGSGAPSITVADAVTITLVELPQAAGPELLHLERREQTDGVARPQAIKTEAETAEAAVPADRGAAEEAAVKVEGSVPAGREPAGEAAWKVEGGVPAGRGAAEKAVVKVEGGVSARSSDQEQQVGTNSASIKSFQAYR